MLTIYNLKFLYPVPLTNNLSNTMKKKVFTPPPVSVYNTDTVILDNL